MSDEPRADDATRAEARGPAPDATMEDGTRAEAREPASGSGPKQIAHFRILRQLKVHTAQARLTGIILTCLPPVVAFIIFGLNYEYMKVIVEETAGWWMIGTSIVLQLVGFVWIRKIVNIEV